MRAASRAGILAWILLWGFVAGCGPIDGGPSDGGAGSDGGGGADGGGRRPVSLRIATFNVHLLFDSTCDSGACGRADFEQVLAPAELDRRLGEIASAVVGLDADVVALQEIETEVVFDALGERLDAVLPYRVFGERGYPGSLDVGLLSRRPIVGLKKHGDRILVRPDGTQTEFTREFLEVHIDVEGARLIVFTGHFRSKNLDDPGRRIAEAQAARAIVAEAAGLLPDSMRVLAGDLNDVPGSETLDALEADGALVRVAAELAPADATFVYRGEPQAIDHVYFDTTGTGAYVPGSARVVGQGEGLAGSDHAALTADFRL